MKVSELKVEDLISHAREDGTDQEVVKSFEKLLPASKSYIKNYTGLTLEEIDNIEEFPIVVMVLANEMYENRLLTVEDDKVSSYIKSILDMNSVNLL